MTQLKLSYFSRGLDFGEETFASIKDLNNYLDKLGQRKSVWVVIIYKAIFITDRLESLNTFIQQFAFNNLINDCVTLYEFDSYKEANASAFNWAYVLDETI